MEPPNELDFYGILKVGRDASITDIKRAFKKLALLYHPDKLGGRAAKALVDAGENFRKVRGHVFTLLEWWSSPQFYN